MTDLEGNTKTFNISTSIRWFVLPDLEVDDETTIEAYLYRTCSGHWVHRVVQTSHSFDLYVVHESVPLEKITEVSVAEAALMLTNPLRPEDQEEAKFPRDILTYLHDISIDGEFSLKGEANRCDGWRDYSAGAKAESGFRFYKTVDQRKRSFDLDTTQVWESPAEPYGSKPKLYRTEDRIWIRCDMLNFVGSVESYKKRPNYWQIDVEDAVDWFEFHDIKAPADLRADLDRQNNLIDVGRYAARISGGHSPLIASAPDIRTESPTDEPSSALIGHEDLSEETTEVKMATELTSSLPGPEPDNLLIFLSATNTVRFRGADFLLSRTAFCKFLKIANATCRLNKDEIGHTKISGVLNKHLPPELRQLIDARGGTGGGYMLKEELGIEVRVLKGL